MTFNRRRATLLLGINMSDSSEVPYGTLDLMVLKTLQAMGPLHGYGIARRIEQVAQGALALNQGTIYPALLRLEQKGWISSEWGTSENNRRARFYAITRSGRKQLAAEAESWARTVAMVSTASWRGSHDHSRNPGSRVKGLFARDRRAVSEEIRTHLDLLADTHVGQGLTTAQARAAARRDFGGVESMKEHYRDQGGLRVIDAIVQDVRYAVRAMRRAPLFSAIAILTLAAGIGANAAMFSVADALVLRPLPVERPDQLRAVHLFITLGGRTAKSSMSLPYSAFETLRASSDVFSGLTAFSELDEIPVALDRADPQMASAAFVSDNYFTMLGVQPRLGRAFSAGVANEVVISDRLWRGVLQADPQVLGRDLRIGTGLFTIAGVAPPEFTGVVIGRAPDVFLPLTALPAAQTGIVIAEDSRFWRVNVVGRLGADISDAVAAERLTTIIRAVPFDPQAPPASIEVLPLETALSDVRARFLRPVQVLMAMVGMLLVVACANVALMLLSRNGARRAEMATRVAIGAGRGRLVQQLMTEGAMLALAAAGVGLLIAPWLARAMVSSLPTDAAPLSVRVVIDGRVLIFTAVISTLAVLLAAAAPAMRTSSEDGAAR